MPHLEVNKLLLAWQTATLVDSAMQAVAAGGVLGVARFRVWIPSLSI